VPHYRAVTVAGRHVLNFARTDPAVLTPGVHRIKRTRATELGILLSLLCFALPTPGVHGLRAEGAAGRGGCGPRGLRRRPRWLRAGGAQADGASGPTLPGGPPKD
jgi:hypothetical protein